MPHQCVHCGTSYEDGSREVLSGCNCGSKFFFYISTEKLKKIQDLKQETIDLTAEEKNQIELDVRDIIGVSKDEEAPIVLDFESVKVLKPGQYLIDLHHLFNKDKPLVYTLEEGKYIVDLVQNHPVKKKR
jgi:predicted  nucleic acid-binding Zn-ribbon protein